MGEKRLEDLFDPSSINELSSLCKEKTYKEGDIITKEGEPPALHFIQEGTVNVTFGSSPSKKLSYGDFFGETSMLINNHINITCIVATPEVNCLVVERDMFFKAFKKMESNLEMGANIIEILTTATFKPKPNTDKAV